MLAYLRAMVNHIGTAFFDVMFVAIVSMSPLLLGRLASVATDRLNSRDYWLFLFNGQLAFYSMSSIAALSLLCLRKKLPDRATLWIGSISLLCLAFLVALVGADPTLQKGQAFFGASAIYLYGGVLFLRILADTMKAVGAGDALEAGARVAAKVKEQLAERMGQSA